MRPSVMTAALKAPNATARRTLPSVVAALRFLDEDGQDVELDANEAAALMAVTDELEAATV